MNQIYIYLKMYIGSQIPFVQIDEKSHINNNEIQITN